MSDACQELLELFDPHTAPYISPSWHAKIGHEPPPLVSRVWGVEIKGGDCAIWLGGNNGKGHGRVRVGKDMWYLHRWSYMCHHNVWIPVDVHIDHLCRNRSCFNPFHLEPTTPLENFQRGDGPKFIFKSLRAKIAETMDDLPF